MNLTDTVFYLSVCVKCKFDNCGDGHGKSGPDAKTLEHRQLIPLQERLSRSTLWDTIGEHNLVGRQGDKTILQENRDKKGENH